MDASDVLVDELDNKVQKLRDWLGSGQAKDYPDYQKICGEIRGLLYAKQEILDLKRKMETQDDE